MSDKIRFFAIIIIVALMIPIAGFLYFTLFAKADADLLIRNASGATISELEVTDGFSTWRLGVLADRQEVRFQEGLRGGESPKISWQWSGKYQEGQGCYYSAPDISSEGELEIIEDELVVIECR